MENKILIITSILPVPDISSKERENDILLRIEEEIISRHSGFQFQYIFVFPWIPRILTLFSNRWKEYWRLRKKTNLDVLGRQIWLLPVIIIPKRLSTRNLFYRVSLSLLNKRINTILKGFKPDITHSQDMEASAVIAGYISQKYHIPYVVTLRNGGNKVDSVNKKLVSKAKELLVPSLTLKRWMENALGREVSFLPHGVSDNFFCAKQIGKDIGPLKLVTVCRLLKLKNLDTVIEAISLITEPISLDIFGEGPEMESLKSLVSDLGIDDRVIFNGWIDQKKLPNRLKEYDLFVMPSFPESLGRVYLEAMSCGLPVIGCLDTGVDGIISDGVEGFLVKERDIVSLKERISMVSQNRELLHEMSTSAINKAEEFRWGKIVQRYIDIYSLKND